MKPSSGDTYIRWGRTTCPDEIDTELLYAGFAAGAHYTNKGGSSDFICLPSDPNWSSNYDDRVASVSYLYGTEYDVGDQHHFSRQNAEVLHDRDAPCAVCRLLERSTKLLFPAKLGCPPKWTEEYRGFLMSAHNNHGRAEAVCVDQAPEVISGSQTNQNGALFYFIEGICGSLPCPPYVNGREITCTVCSI
ncbi:short-chain collagen C4-like [Patiria miniata]|uniref:Short-chain collagen C4 n=1 Tax=Patiria miniata TaxID=46514 RepID=A0A914AB38_PATMI|nr:short-chain collagen C4-like [Patiria miniata]